jgi:hypothetical protein
MIGFDGCTILDLMHLHRGASPTTGKLSDARAVKSMGAAISCGSPDGVGVGFLDSDVMAVHLAVVMRPPCRLNSAIKGSICPILKAFANDDK